MPCHSRHLTSNPTTQVIPLQCLREISTGLPVSGAALSKVEHMTGHRMKHYQEVILSVTKEFQKKRLDHLASQALARQEEMEDDDFAPSSVAAGPRGSEGWLGRNQGTKRGGGGKSAYFKKTGGGGAQKRKQTNSAGNSPKRKSRPNNTSSMGLPKSKY